MESRSQVFASKGIPFAAVSVPCRLAHENYSKRGWPLGRYSKCAAVEYAPYMTFASVHPASRPVSAHVLVIDDDEVMRELLQAVLSAEGHTVETAESGEAGLALLRGGHRADVLLMDVQLPGLSGPELAAELRNAVPTATLIGMSGSEPASAVRAAFDTFLLKPFSPEDFAAAMLSVKEEDAGASGAMTEAKATSAVSAGGSKAVAAAGPALLDEGTCARLAASLPAAQLAELYQLTLDDISVRLTRMREIQTAGDITAYRREAHALKGGCSMVGAAEMAALAARAETGSFGDTPALTDFVTAAERLRSILTERFVHNKE